MGLFSKKKDKEYVTPLSSNERDKLKSVLKDLREKYRKSIKHGEKNINGVSNDKILRSIALLALIVDLNSGKKSKFENSRTTETHELTYRTAMIFMAHSLMKDLIPQSDKLNPNTGFSPLNDIIYDVLTPKNKRNDKDKSNYLINNGLNPDVNPLMIEKYSKGIQEKLDKESYYIKLSDEDLKVFTNEQKIEYVQINSVNMKSNVDENYDKFNNYIRSFLNYLEPNAALCVRKTAFFNKMNEMIETYCKEGDTKDYTTALNNFTQDLLNSSLSKDPVRLENIYTIIYECHKYAASEFGLSDQLSKFSVDIDSHFQNESVPGNKYTAFFKDKFSPSNTVQVEQIPPLKRKHGSLSTEDGPLAPPPATKKSENNVEKLIKLFNSLSNPETAHVSNKDSASPKR